MYLILSATLDPAVYAASKEMSIKKKAKMFLASKARQVREADLTAICELSV
jgi:hypothetical protein